VIYVDSSVALAALFAETDRPPDTLWDAPCIASRLTDLEVRVRAAARRLPASAMDDMEQILARIEWVEVSALTMSLIYQSPPAGVRTLDAIHLATLEFVNRELGHTVLATYDSRLARAAAALDFTVVEP
jgi:predicted nucleic acid-binding protein